MKKRLANTWYETESMGNGVTLIRETSVAPWLRCNIWHVRGRTQDLIIDTGMGLKPLKQEISMLAERPVICISTHAHFDHIGGAHEFDCRLGHQSEADIHAAPDQFNTGDWGPFVRAETFTALPYEGFNFEEYIVRAAPLTGYLDEGDVIDLGDRSFHVMHLPGHSPGSIALYERKAKRLFSGDVVYDGALFDTVYHSDKEVYRESLQRLKDLPVDEVHGGHYDSFNQVRMIELVDAYLAGRNRIQHPENWVSAQI
jgi:glyoxylase-like metal-dependent hydrolase (beta-lactamase superfamily II)